MPTAGGNPSLISRVGSTHWGPVGHGGRGWQPPQRLGPDGRVIGSAETGWEDFEALTQGTPLSGLADSLGFKRARLDPEAFHQRVVA